MTPPSSPSPAPGIVLFAHGSRDPLWRQPIEDVAQRIRLLSPGSPVACAYLELTDPDLPSACAQLLDAHPQTSHIRVLPMFLGMGKHARTDLPELMQALRSQHPGIVFEQSPPLGESESMQVAIAHWALQPVA